MRCVSEEGRFDLDKGCLNSYPKAMWVMRGGRRKEMGSLERNSKERWVVLGGTDEAELTCKCVGLYI